MFKQLPTFVALFFTGFLLLMSCDRLPETSNDLPGSKTILKQLRFVQDTLSFRDALTIKDTTVAFAVEVEVSDVALLSQNPVVSMYEKGGYMLVSSDTLYRLDKTLPIYSGTLNFTISTGATAQAEVIANAFAIDGSSTNALRRSFNVVGLQVLPAEVVQIIAPDTIFIPTSGSVNFLIKAEVTHPNDPSFIGQVLLEIFSENADENLGTFRLYDDGSANTIENSGLSGDETANDSIFSRMFTISDENSADRLQLKVHATDISGGESNFMTRTLVFIK